MSKTSQRRLQFLHDKLDQRQTEANDNYRLSGSLARKLRGKPRKFFKPNYRKKMLQRAEYLQRMGQYAAIHGASVLMPKTRKALGL